MLRSPHERVTCCLLLLAGCGSGFGPKSVDSDDPSAKIPAIKQAADDKDMSHVAQMVKDLDSDDPAVRFYSIVALEKLTGDNFGYVYYQDEAERAPAVKRWNQWLASRGEAPTTTRASS